MCEYILDWTEYSVQVEESGRLRLLNRKSCRNVVFEFNISELITVHGMPNILQTIIFISYAGM